MEIFDTYSLAKKGKWDCPYCKRKKKFVLYLNDRTGEPLHPTIGKCDGSDKCGAHHSPREIFANNRISFDSVPRIKPMPKPTPKPEPSPSYIDRELLKRTLTGYEGNRFVRYLRSIVGDEAAGEATSRYFIGTSKHFDGATVFWQIDEYGCVRTGKIMQYDSHTGKRIHGKNNWVHSVLNLPDFNLIQCLFGTHLIHDKSKTVAICESEKTAIIASVYLPDMIWVASGGYDGLSLKRCEPLRGREVILYPDAGKFDGWSKKAKELSVICDVSVSSLIEEGATDEERQAGFDLADYLVRFSPSEFIRQSSPQQPAAVTAEKSTVHSNSVVAAMCAKNPALSRLMATFDCEVTRTDKYEPKPSRMLTGIELKRLAAGLPDHDSWTETELCRLLKIEPQQVRSMADRKEIYFIQLTGKYARTGCTPF